MSKERKRYKRNWERENHDQNILYKNSRTGKREGVDRGTGGGKRAYGTCGEWGPRKGEII